MFRSISSQIKQWAHEGLKIWNVHSCHSYWGSSCPVNSVLAPTLTKALRQTNRDFYETRFRSHRDALLVEHESSGRPGTRRCSSAARPVHDPEKWSLASCTGMGIGRQTTKVLDFKLIDGARKGREEVLPILLVVIETNVLARRCHVENKQLAGT